MNTRRALIGCLLAGLVAGCATTGTTEAKQDLAAGRLAIRTAGLPSHATPLYAHLLKSRYGIDYRIVAGCVVDEPTLTNMGQYNQVMEAEITRRFGPGVLEKTFEEAKRQDDTLTAQLSHPAACKLRIRFWVQGGIAGGLQRAVQIVHNSPADRSDYPFDLKDADVVHASDRATKEILRLLYTSRFWEEESDPGPPGAMDLMTEVIVVEADGVTNRVKVATGSTGSADDPETLIDRILKIAAEYPATQPAAEEPQGQTR